jgi:hypothetical protein
MSLDCQPSAQEAHYWKSVLCIAGQGGRGARAHKIAHQKLLDCPHHGVPAREDGVHEQDMPLVNVIWKLAVHERLLIRLHSSASNVGINIIHRLWALCDWAVAALGRLALH